MTREACLGRRTKKLKEASNVKKVLAMFLTVALMGVLASGAMAAAPLKVALVVAGGLGDKSFYDSANAGIERAAGQLGVQTKVIECRMDPSNFVPYLATAGKNFDLIFVAGFEFIDALPQIAPQFPDKDFVQMDYVGDAPGVSYVDFLENEGSFLAGALAASMSKGGVIGAVMGEDIPVMHSFLTGYTQGAQAVNKDIKVLSGFSGSWDDPAKGKELALSQKNGGADVIYQIAGGTGTGVLEASREGGFWGIGVDSAQELDYPDTVLTSMLKRLDVAVFDIIKAKQEGSFQRGVFTYGLKNGGVGLSWSDVAKKNIPADVQQQLKDLEQQIIDGKIVVEDAK